MGDQVMARIARLGMTPRQQMLNHLWGWYRCTHYESRKYDWDGQQHADPLEHEAIATAGFIPPGFYDAGHMFPLKFKRPTAPYNLVKVIVDRFTATLFSERRHPNLRVDGDPDTEDYVHALVEASRLWPAMMQARTFGGATGSVAVGFQFVSGKPIVEVHDPRWIFPQFKDRIMLTLSSIEKRYIYPMEMRDPETGEWKEVPFWYRRIIDEESDVLYKPEPVGDGEEPEWQEDIRVDHRLGFCPVVWIQNMPALDDIDGDPDCTGIYELVESIDTLLAQANVGTVSNCDPTVTLITDAQDIPELRKGSRNAIRLPTGSAASYMEISGSGPEAARKMAEEFRKYALEVAQCVLEHPEMERRTATEIERVYSTMIAKADILREQYGQRGVIPLVEMMIDAARKLSIPVVNGDGQIERQTLNLPPKVQPDSPDRIARTLGPGGVLKIQWPGYFEPTLTDIELATRSAIAAKAGGLIDSEHASKFVAGYYRVEDVPGMMKKVESEAKDQQEAIAASAMAGLPMPGSGGGHPYGKVR
jgi:hypothetical protein